MQNGNFNSTKSRVPVIPALDYQESIYRLKSFLIRIARIQAEETPFPGQTTTSRLLNIPWQTLLYNQRRLKELSIQHEPEDGETVEEVLKELNEYVKDCLRKVKGEIDVSETGPEKRCFKDIKKELRQERERKNSRKGRIHKETKVEHQAKEYRIRGKYKKTIG